MFLHWGMLLRGRAASVSANETGSVFVFTGQNSLPRRPLEIEEKHCWTVCRSDELQDAARASPELLELRFLWEKYTIKANKD